MKAHVRHTALYLAFTLLALVYLFPFFYLLLGSVKNARLIMNIRELGIY